MRGAQLKKVLAQNSAHFARVVIALIRCRYLFGNCAVCAPVGM